MAHKGRPTEYTPEILAKAQAYLDLGYAEDEKIPSVAGLSRFLGIARSTIYDWAGQDDKVEFSDILEQILAKQEYTLLNKGISGEFNSTITKLVLAKQGYKESVEQEINNPDGNLKTIVINKYAGTDKSNTETE